MHGHEQQRAADLAEQLASTRSRSIGASAKLVGPRQQRAQRRPPASPATAWRQRCRPAARRRPGSGVIDLARARDLALAAGLVEAPLGRLLGLLAVRPARRPSASAAGEQRRARPRAGSKNASSPAPNDSMMVANAARICSGRAMKKTWKVGIRRLSTPMREIHQQADQQQRRRDPHAERERLAEQPGQELGHVAERRRAPGRQAGVARRQRLQQQVVAVGDEQQHQRGRDQEVARQRALGRPRWDRRSPPLRGPTGMPASCRRRAARRRRTARPRRETGRAAPRRRADRASSSGAAGRPAGAGASGPASTTLTASASSSRTAGADVGFGEPWHHHQRAAGAHEDQQQREQIARRAARTASRRRARTGRRQPSPAMCWNSSSPKPTRVAIMNGSVSTMVEEDRQDLGHERERHLLHLGQRLEQRDQHADDQRHAA